MYFPRILLLAWVAAALLSSLFALLQYFGLAVWFGPLISTAEVGEAFANLRQRNQFATLTNIGLAAFLIDVAHPIKWATNAEVRPQQGIQSKYVLAILLFTTADAAASSRTGLLQLLVLVIAGTVFLHKNFPAQVTVMRKLLLISLMSYLVASITLPVIIGLDPQHSGILGRFHDGGGACQSRLVLWSNVLHLIAQKPWLGWGWGELSYAHFITLYPGERFCDILDNAHNLPLHLAVELGVPFSLAFCSVCIWLIAREKPWREQDPSRQLAWSVLALIGLHSMLEYPLWYGPFQVTVLLCLYLLWRTPASWRSEEAPSRVLSPVARQVVIAVSALVMAACVYAAWDYWRITQIYTPPSLRAAAYQDDTLRKIQDSWLFQRQVRFAEFSITPLTSENAVHMNLLAKELLHFSPETKVVKKLIESAVMLGDDAEAAYYLQRFKAAFPDAKL